MATFWISQSNGCWVDLFERAEFQGGCVRLHGPADFVNLWVAPDNWCTHVHSLAAGPNAYVLCFEEMNIEGSALWVMPSQKVGSVDKATNVDLDSLRLFDRPPFAVEPGYGAYARTVGGQVESPKPPRRRRKSGN